MPIVNLRRGCPIMFGDRDSAQAYELEVQQAERAQTVAYAVAPRMRLKLPDERMLSAGNEVKPADLEGSVDGCGQRIAPLAKLRGLVASGHVLEGPRSNDDGRFAA